MCIFTENSKVQPWYLCYTNLASVPIVISEVEKCWFNQTLKIYSLTFHPFLFFFFLSLFLLLLFLAYHCSYFETRCLQIVIYMYEFTGSFWCEIGHSGTVRNVIAEFQAGFAAQLDLKQKRRGQGSTCWRFLVAIVQVRGSLGTADGGSSLCWGIRGGVGSGVNSSWYVLLTMCW